MTITASLLEQLKNHYLEPGATWPGGVFAAEVGINGNWGTGRRCDALYAGFTSQSGRILIGHEVKVSRADWNHERDNLEKADQWADQCHAWYLVAPSVAIIPADEVPPGWGLMVPDPRAKRRFKIVVKATVHKDRNPSWGAVRSFMSRMDTVAAKNTEAVIRERVTREVASEVERQLKYAERSSADAELEKLRALQDRIETALGMKIADYAWGETINPETLGKAIALARKMEPLVGRNYGQGLDQLVGRLSTTVDDLNAAKAKVLELQAAMTLELANP